jgi:hypothetical protein
MQNEAHFTFTVHKYLLIYHANATRTAADTAKEENRDRSVFIVR